MTPVRNICRRRRAEFGTRCCSGPAHGFRNAQATVLAPTGTISFMMDCDTTGIEPDIALVKYKQLAGGGMLKIVNRTVPMALQTLGYDEPRSRRSSLHRRERHDRRGARSARRASAGLRLCLQAGQRRAQHSLEGACPDDGGRSAVPSGAISKTVNMPTESTTSRISPTPTPGAGSLGLKAMAIYRDGSKQSQPLSTPSPSRTRQGRQGEGRRPRRERLPDTRQSHHAQVQRGGHEGYINVGLYPDGRRANCSSRWPRKGAPSAALMDCFGTAISMSLQYGVPLEVLVNKFSHTRFEPMGHTTNPDIRIAKSVVDYIFRWLGITFMPGFREARLPHVR
jgi:ribonucleoside-diphosphate reductase alpha chain